MFSIGKCKSPGIDGFTTKKFQVQWDIVGQDVIIVVFFLGYGRVRNVKQSIIQGCMWNIGNGCNKYAFSNHWVKNCVPEVKSSITLSQA